ncbi:hypothetical protein ACFLRC_03780 [Candidatus Altiarchaeota archaeon]
MWEEMIKGVRLRKGRNLYWFIAILVLFAAADSVCGDFSRSFNSPGKYIEHCENTGHEMIVEASGSQTYYFTDEVSANCPVQGQSPCPSPTTPCCTIGNSITCHKNLANPGPTSFTYAFDSVGEDECTFTVIDNSGDPGDLADATLDIWENTCSDNNQDGDGYHTPGGGNYCGCTGEEVSECDTGNCASYCGASCNQCPRTTGYDEWPFDSDCDGSYNFDCTFSTPGGLFDLWMGWRPGCAPLTWSELVSNLLQL